MCETCEDAEENARHAQVMGRAALRLLGSPPVTRDTMTEVFVRLEEASKLERRHGDDPTWGRPLRTAEALRDRLWRDYPKLSALMERGRGYPLEDRDLGPSERLRVLADIRRYRRYREED